MLTGIIFEVINIVYIGQSGASPDMLAGMGLGNMFINIFCMSVIVGLNGAVETLVA
jgi:hypothetical protein